jgi:hypothetical protein
MRKVFIAAHPAEAYMIRGLLESEGIDAIVRGEALFSARGLTSVTPDTLPSVWVLDPGQAERALELIAAPRTGARSPARRDRAWRCPTCNEFIGPEFAACWKCGNAEPAEAMARRA